MEELLIIERKISAIKKEIKDKKGKHCIKLKIKLWWYKNKYERMKERIWK